MEIVRAVADNQARINVTFAGQNGDMADSVPVDATDEEVKRWVTEAVRAGSVPGIRADEGADLTDFVVDRFPPTEARPWALRSVRPKTPFGL